MDEHVSTAGRDSIEKHRFSMEREGTVRIAHLDGTLVSSRHDDIKSSVTMGTIQCDVKEKHQQLRESISRYIERRWEKAFALQHRESMRRRAARRKTRTCCRSIHLSRRMQNRMDQSDSPLRPCQLNLDASSSLVTKRVPYQQKQPPKSRGKECFST